MLVCLSSVVLVVCLLATACGGGNAEEASTSTTAASTSGATDAAGAAPSDAETEPPDGTTAVPVVSTTSTTSAPDSFEGGATYVTGHLADFSMDEGVVTTNSDGTSRSRDGTVTYRLVANDPRVTGTVTATWHSDRWGTFGDAAVVQWGEATLTNDGGTWVAPYAGIWTTSLGDFVTRWWRGTGAYAGLSFYMAIPGGTNPWEWIGLIYPGAPPPGA